MRLLIIIIIFDNSDFQIIWFATNMFHRSKVHIYDKVDNISLKCATLLSYNT